MKWRMTVLFEADSGVNMKRENSKFRVLPAMKVVAVMAAAAASPGRAEANCWHDTNVTQLAQSVAQSGFPNAASRMPTVLVCDGGDFGPNIGGDYTGGIHRIRIPNWQLNRTELRSVIAHEMAHAEVWLTGGSDANGGHSSDFMRSLLRAGWHAEAARVGQYVGGAQFALDEARASLYGQGAGRAPLPGAERPPIATPPPIYVSPTVMVQVCHDQPFVVYRPAGRGQYYIEIVTRRFCQWVQTQ